MGDEITKNILLLDADLSNQAFLGSFFTKTGFTVVFVKNEAEALSELSAKPFLLILIDIFTSDLAGVASLQNIIKATTNKTPIVVISEANSKDLVENCIKSGAKDFIAKPINVEKFVRHVGKLVRLKTSKSASPALKPNVATKSKIDKHNEKKGEKEDEKKGGSKSLIEELVDRLKHDKLDFSVMPQMGYKIIELLRDEKTPLDKVNELIEKDPGIFSRILKAANSAVYAAGKPVYTPKEAIQRIGVRRTIDYTLIISSARLFKNPNPAFDNILKDVLGHSLCAGICAREIGNIIKYPEVDHLFAFGLLHDIGKVLLLRILNEIEKERKLDNEEDLVNLLDKLHTKFGASLMKKWNFPNEFHEAVLFHHDKTGHSKRLASTVITSLANILAREVDDATINENTNKLLSLPQVKLLGIRANSFDDFVKRVNSEKEVLASLID
ncbi:MAG: response regulator [Gammaproteobacteria bacterium]|nr:response regulator [Gammaproteobacteria bacterium]